MSLCQKCHAPGACCKGFMLQQLTPWMPRENIPHALAEARVRLDAMGLTYFVPTGETEKDLLKLRQGDWEVVKWMCTRLGPDGRCTDYENRPQTCISYQPMDDALCAVRHLKGIPILVEHA